MIKIIDLHKRFGEQVVMKNLNLSISTGEIVFVIGKSGTGKSVLLKMLVGLMKATSGQIIIDGTDISNFTEEEFLPIRRKCGMVFQHPALFDSLTIYENIAFGMRRILKVPESQIQQKILEYLHHVHLPDVLQKKPPQLSYGMQKRASIARTLAIQPEVLLFDEPTTGLDPISTHAINNLIQELSRELKTTSIVVSHDMGCALSIADRIIVLDQGELIAAGPPMELMKSSVPLIKDFMSEVTPYVESRI